MMAMLSKRAVQCARELRGLLRDGMLARDGPVDAGGGTLMLLSTAVRIVLSDLDDLTDDGQNNGHIGRERWQKISDELEYLHTLAGTGQWE
jgi:hypothetical protein